MLTKFESKSARVKGLAFHPVRPWVCASLHNGVIQLWDYRVGTVIDRFEEHDGPVRGVDFHWQEPLLVSGGDDYKIKVWDYKLRRCLFTLLGHLDYIRTVQFHPGTQPWILSASDDQTLRLWDYAKRTCLSVLTGHNHYVMCAAFHPVDDLIVSASLDQTVRVWDTTGLRKKQTEALSAPAMRGGGPGHHQQGLNVQAELFGTNDVVVKYVLEGHDRGVNWACFHPTLPLLASAADDRQVKLWRMSETKAWEVDTLRGHANNVSSCLFHPKHDLVVSNSEDRSIRVWDVSKRVGVQTFRREGDRFWILAAHKTQNLLAAGHDSGMIVFKLERERPAACHGPSPTQTMYYVRGRELFLHDAARSAGNTNTGLDVPITSLRRMGSQAQTDGIGSAPRFLTYNHHNPTEGNLLVTSEVDGGSYELVTFGLGNANASVSDGKRGSCLGPGVFLGRNRFCILDRQRQIVIKNMNNETTKRLQPPVPNVDGLLDGGASGRVLLRAEDRAILFEVQSRRVLGELTAPKIKSVVWSPDGSKVAILCKYGIVMADKQLEQLCSISDNVRIKSGAWDVTPTGGTSSEMFVYTTLHHVKYCLPSGDVGTIRTLDQPVYAMRVIKDQLWCLDREARPRVLQVDTTEARFKLALAQKRYNLVMKMVQKSRLCGRAIVAYLQSKGFPEVALHFVQDPQTRFRLALACGNIEIAMECAFALEQSRQSQGGSADQVNRDIWGELGSEALRQGNHQVVEMSYQRTKDFDRLSFLYLITGDTEKLAKMLKIASMRNDVMGRYHNALLLGNAQERVHILEESGNYALAYISAKMHGLEDDAERIKITIETNKGSVDDLMTKATAHTEPKSSGCLLQPPTPILRNDNWPTLEITKTTLENLSAQQGDEAYEEELRQQEAAGGAGPMEEEWMEEDEPVEAGVSGGLAAPDEDFDFGDGDDMGDWGDDLDDLGDLGGAPAPKPVDDMDDMGDMDSPGGFNLPTAGRPPAGCWVANSSHSADHLAAGAASSALQLLNRQIAASEFALLKDSMISCYLGATLSVPGVPGSPSLNMPLLRNDSTGHPGNESLPRTPLDLKSLVTGIRNGYRFFQGGKFNDARASFATVLTQIPLVVTSNRAEANEIKEMVAICREYITSIRIKGAMSEAASDPVRSTELSAYFTHCNLQSVHLLLALRSAMGTAFKHKNFIAAAGFARRLLELPDMSSERNADLRSKATKVLQKSEQMARNEHELMYDESKTFTIDCETFNPIYAGTADSVSCSYCGSTYNGGMANKLCLTCGFCTVGIQTIGLVTG
uniref:Coatomer subunit alpha n=1 Tax=Amphora coffeiformis TaxID=265554 RepID=A0A7S3L3C1_9STRA|mmetsp:Transcript_10637/g.20308  ORF Transcript_10637/g.20308 Transcript_10637/m.20308 type:complete len:1292 (+) Transcript_10637:103-3978(+)|eukprot:scaffold14203_cov170-Amphora_coffeaeformis.AAC.10